MTALYHLANVLFLLAYAVKEVFYLRLLALAGSLCVVIYYFVHSGFEGPFIYWSILYAAMNTFHIAVIIYERRPIVFSEAEQRLYQLVFRGLTPAEFKKLVALVRWETVGPETVLIRHEELLDRVYVIVEGAASVRRGGEEVARLVPGQFLGEMSLLDDSRSSADVVSLGGLTYVWWSREAIASVLNKHRELRSAWQLAIGKDLVEKLRTTSPQAAAQRA